MKEPLWKELNRKYKKQRDIFYKETYGMSYEDWEVQQAKEHVSHYTPEEREQAYYNLTHPSDNSYDERDVSNWVTNGTASRLRQTEINDTWRYYADWYYDDGERRRILNC